MCRHRFPLFFALLLLLCKVSTFIIHHPFQSSYFRIHVDLHQQQPESQKHSQGGDLANVHYQAISMKDLRLHPLFTALPKQLYINHTKDISLFRQTSWQWSFLHRGRLTTSKAAAMLGIYDMTSASTLGVPRSLVGHERMSRALMEIIMTKTPRNQTHINLDFLNGDVNRKNDDDDDNDNDDGDTKTSPWKIDTSSNPKFAYVYKSKRQRNELLRGYSSSSAARLAWGNAQESTGVLCALNYLHNNHPDAKLCEIGRCGVSTFEALLLYKYIYTYTYTHTHTYAHSCTPTYVHSYYVRSVNL